MAIKDEVGNRYGHLKVIKYAYTHPKRRCAFGYVSVIVENK